MTASLSYQSLNRSCDLADQSEDKKKQAVNVKCVEYKASFYMAAMGEGWRDVYQSLKADQGY